MKINYPKAFKEELFRQIATSNLEILPTLDTWEEEIEDGEEHLIISFLKQIWDLGSMPSQDRRFDNAYEDALQHLVNNSDWNYERIFIYRFDLLEDDETFTKFLEAIVHPDFRKGEENIRFIVNKINEQLIKIGYVYNIDSYLSHGYNKIPIYQIGTLKVENQSNLDNKIPFFHVMKPNQYPCFVLEQDNWNDYSYRTLFQLKYFERSNYYVDIGDIKITDGSSIDTSETLKNKFYRLGDDFCSLGQDEDYYFALRDNKSLDLEQVLSSLNDTGYFGSIYEKFQSNNIFNTSLIRYDEVERLLRNLKHILEGNELTDKYKFEYSFKPNYSETSLMLKLNFSDNYLEMNRIFAIIGENGTGKTQLISKLPLDLSLQEPNELFSPSKPIFGKVIAVSYSAFDKYIIPNPSDYFAYKNIGLKDLNFTEEDEGDRFIDLFNNHIKLHKRERKWHRIILKFIEEDLLQDFIKINARGLSKFKIDKIGYTETIKKFSSGQRILFEIITNIIAFIRFDSLILFDEPETHLHPNAISQLVSAIYELTDEFDSYCLMTTHSPIIIQNIFGKNVYVMKKDGNYPSLRKIGIECFGENLTVLTEDVFGNRDIEKHYKKILDEFINELYTYEKVVEKIEENGLPLSLNAKLYLKSQVNEEN